MSNQQRSAYVRGLPKPSFTLKECTILKETDKALLIEKDGVEYWLPLSQVSGMVRTKTKETDEVTMTDWIARTKGLL